jgi:hypothetical protein
MMLSPAAAWVDCGVQVKVIRDTPPSRSDPGALLRVRGERP